MMRRGEIARLRSLTDMVLQVQLASLKSAIRARQKTQDQIAGLQTAAPEIDENTEISDALAMLQYQHWAERRRSELSVILASQTAYYLAARDHAQLAFGKVQGIDSLAARFAARKNINTD